MTRRALIAGVATAAVLATVVPSLGATNTDDRCRAVADNAARCPVTSEVGPAIPAIATRSVSLPNGGVLVLGADANYDRLSATLYDDRGAAVYHRRSYVGGHVALTSATASADGSTVVAGGFLNDFGEDLRPLVVAVDTRTGRLRWNRVSANRGRTDGVAGVAADARRGVTYAALFLEERKGTYIDDLVVQAIRTRDGHLVWSKRIGRLDRRDEYPMAVSYAGGRVVVTGAEQKRTQSGPGDYDYAVWCFNARTGRLAGEVRYDGGNGDDLAYAAATTPDNRFVAVTGTSPGGPAGEVTGIATMLVDPVRVRAVWVTRTDGPEPDAVPWTVAVAGGHVVVGAASGLADLYSPAPGVYGEVRDVHRATAIGFDVRSGVQSWRQDVTQAADAYAAQLAVSPSGRTVYWTGTVAPSQAWVYGDSILAGGYVSAPADAFVVAVDTATGATRWTARWNPDPNGAGQVWVSSAAASAHGVVVAGEATAPDATAGRLDNTWEGLALAYAD